MVFEHEVWLHEWHDGCQHLPCLILIYSPSWIEVGNGIIELLSCRCEGQILGQAVLLTNSFLVGILMVAIFLLNFWRRRLSRNAFHCSGKSWCSLSCCFLSWSSSRSALHTVWQLLVLLKQGFQLQCLGAFYCIGPVARISIGTRASHAGAGKYTNSKYSRIHARISHLYRGAHRCASGKVMLGHP